MPKRVQNRCEQESTKIDKKYENQILGIFPILVEPLRLPYQVSEENQERITQVLLKNHLMGSNINLNSKEEAIEYLIKRDHEKLLNLLNGKITHHQLGLYCIPPVFFSQMPEVVSHEEYKTKLDSQKTGNYLSNYWKSGTFRGDLAERNVFDQLKSYFQSKMDACLFLHNHYFLHKNNFKEKDFIILNLTKGYVMVIEVKVSTRNISKALNQLEDAKTRVQAVFNSIKKMSNGWKFIGIIFLQTEDFCFKHDFKITYADDFEAKMDKIDQLLYRQSHWNPDNHVAEFVAVAKHLVYEAQGHTEAPISGKTVIGKVSAQLDRASSFENILFWTPEQLSIVQAMNVDHMCLMGYFGVGKTIILIERALRLAENTDNDIYFFVETLEHKGKTQFQIDLENKFAKHKNIRVKSINTVRMQTSPEELNRFVSNHDIWTHVLIDEVNVHNLNSFYDFIKNLQSRTFTLWMAIGHLNCKPIELCEKLKDLKFVSPTLKYCLRNGTSIAKYSKSYNSLYMDQFSTDVKIGTNTNQGILEVLPHIFDDPIEALEKALKKIPAKQKTFIWFNSPATEFSTLQKKLPNYNFVNFTNEMWRKYWLNFNDANSHLVYIGSGFASIHYHIYSVLPVTGNELELAGLEFDSVICVYHVCSKCKKGENNRLVLTRAKASLVVAKYSKDCKPNC